MLITQNISDLPKSLEEFQIWEQTDGFKYENIIKLVLR
jgi:hypothetical protein